MGEHPDLGSGLETVDVPGSGDVRADDAMTAWVGNLSNGAAGDLDGDGYVDVIGQGGYGWWYVVPGPIPDAASADDATWSGRPPDETCTYDWCDFSETDVALGEDVDGHVWLAAGYTSMEGTDYWTARGGACVFSGGFEGSEVCSEDGWQFAGGTDDLAGGAVAVGDIDGDGETDLVVGARGADPAGAAYLFYGPLDGARTMLALVGDPSGGSIGASVAFVPDVNGDGADELLVGGGGATSMAVMFRGRSR